MSVERRLLTDPSQRCEYGIDTADGVCQCGKPAAAVWTWEPQVYLNVCSEHDAALHDAELTGFTAFPDEAVAH